MVRRTGSKQITYNARVLAFQLVRRDACAQFQQMGALYGLAGLNAQTVAACEQDTYQYLFFSILAQRVYSSVYCLRFYKLAVQELLGLPPPTLIAFLSGSLDRTKLLDEVRAALLHGTPYGYETPPCPPSGKVAAKTTAQLAADQLDEACSDGLGDQFTQVCRKCKTNRHVEFNTVQTRSADEGMTVEFECKKCKTKWRGDS
jgi:hypothetical protein